MHRHTNCLKLCIRFYFGKNHELLSNTPNSRLSWLDTFISSFSVRSFNTHHQMNLFTKKEEDLCSTSFCLEPQFFVFKFKSADWQWNNLASLITYHSWFQFLYWQFLHWTHTCPYNSLIQKHGKEQFYGASLLTCS